jgi:hypothetical protein
MIDLTVQIHEKDKCVAAMVKALSFETAPSLIARSASVKGAKMDASGHFTLHMADNIHRTKFVEAVSKYLPNLVTIK